MSSEVTFPQTAVTGSTQCVGVTLVDDSIVENTEQFSAQVTSTSEITLIASPSTATYSMVDSDSEFPSSLSFSCDYLSLIPQLLQCPW